MKLSLIIALLLLGTLARAEEYVYTVQVDVLDPRESPIVISLTWPGGSKTNTLAKRGMVSATSITWPAQDGSQGKTVPMRGGFRLTVEISKGNHFTWRKTYSHSDFVPMADGTRRILDKIVLSVEPHLGTPEQLEALSQSLPLGLSPYSEFSVSDRDRDGEPDEAWLWRMTSDSDSPYQKQSLSRSLSRYEEIRQMRLTNGQWNCDFLANHKGVFVGGKRVAGTPAAPFGYSFSARTYDAGLIYDDLYAIDEDGRRRPGQMRRSYFWSRNQGTIEVLVFDRTEPSTLLAYLKHPSSLVASRAAHSITASRDKAFVGALIDALSHESAHARSSIVSALERLSGQRFGQDVDRWKKWHRESQQLDGAITQESAQNAAP